MKYLNCNRDVTEQTEGKKRERESGRLVPACWILYRMRGDLSERAVRDFALFTAVVCDLRGRRFGHFNTKMQSI